MKVKALGLAAVAAMALMASVASSASATVLEVGGVKKDKESVAITASLKGSTSTIWTRTDGSFINECAESHVAGATENDGSGDYSGPTVTAVVNSLSFNSCIRTVTVHQKGKLHVAWQSNTDGTVSWSGTETTVGSPFGHLRCTTGTGVHIGTLTGTDGTPAEHAEVHVNAVLHCGFLVPTAHWRGTYIVTSPTGLGVLNN